MLTKSKIIRCDDKSQKSVQDFVAKHPNSLIYHTEIYKQLIKDHLDCDLEYYFLESDEKVEALLAGMSKDGRFGRVFNALPFFGSNGGILASSANAYRLMMTHYNQLIADMSFATFIENPFEIGFVTPDYDLISHRVCQITDTENLSLENLNKIFTSKKRNDLRRSFKHKITVDIDFSDEAKDYLINTHITNMKAINAANKSEAYLNELFSRFRPGVNFDLFTAKKDNELIAALLVLYHNRIVEYYVPVISSQHRQLQALSLIIYEAMKFNKSLNRTIWNWGANGNALDSVYKFKKSWGASDCPYKYFTKVKNNRHEAEQLETLTRDYRGFYLFPFTSS